MPMKSFTHLEAGDHGPVLPLLIVPEYNVDGPTKGSENKGKPEKSTIENPELQRLHRINTFVDSPNKLFNCIRGRKNIRNSMNGSIF